MPAVDESRPILSDRAVVRDQVYVGWPDRLLNRRVRVRAGDPGAKGGEAGGAHDLLPPNAVEPFHECLRGGRIRRALGDRDTAVNDRREITHVYPSDELLLSWGKRAPNE